MHRPDGEQKRRGSFVRAGPRRNVGTWRRTRQASRRKKRRAGPWSGGPAKCGTTGGELASRSETRTPGELSRAGPQRNVGAWRRTRQASRDKKRRAGPWVAARRFTCSAGRGAAAGTRQCPCTRQRVVRAGAVRPPVPAVQAIRLCLAWVKGRACKARPFLSVKQEKAAVRRKTRFAAVDPLSARWRTVGMTASPSSAWFV